MKTNILDLIRQNQHEKALSFLRHYLIDSPLLNEVIMIDSRFKNYTHRYIHKLLSHEQLELEKNQLTHAMLSVLEKLPHFGKNKMKQDCRMDYNAIQESSVFQRY